MSELNVNLMFRDRAFDLNARRCYGHGILAEDFELKHVIDAMARSDDAVREVCNTALFCPLTSLEEIAYRQAILRDARKNTSAFFELYAIVMDAERLPGEITRSVRSTAGAILITRDLLHGYTDILHRLRTFADGAAFDSDGLKRLCATLKTELSDAFFKDAYREIKEFSDIDAEEMLISAVLDEDLHDIRYTLRKKVKNVLWMQWSLVPGYNFDADSGLSQSGDWLARIGGAISPLSDALSSITYDVARFFKLLRYELAFYSGCLNLEETLRSYGLPVCIPDVNDSARFDREYRGLYDSALALVSQKAVVGNDLDASDVKLYVVTGANQGGKSTFLRSVGQSQLMAQCGMPICAEHAVIPLRRMVYSHFKREEDGGMRSGKLDEEMRRMNEIAEYMQPDSMILLNESFASTNEREGSEICQQITRAFVKNGVEVFSVSHLYSYAASFLGEDNVMFLRAQRLDDGTRSFVIERGDPLKTAFGGELYDRIFG